ncbi:MAG: hypothetical protein PUF90_00390 [Lachnospiraceae bacterium]|nr:hypothetical protein [Lachnospiraceae bacterium]
MCKVIEEMRKEVWNEAWNKASSEAERKTKASVRRLYLQGLSFDQIAAGIDLPVDEVKDIISSES